MLNVILLFAPATPFISNKVPGEVSPIPTFSLLSIVIAVLVALSSIPVDVKSVIVAPDAMLTESPLAPIVNVVPDCGYIASTSILLILFY